MQLECTESGLWVPKGLPKRLDDRFFDYANQHRAVYGLSPVAGASSRTYMAFNGASPTTAAPVAVTTGTAIKTMQQVQTGTVTGLRVIEWGVSFTTVAATLVACELISTGAINATVTTYAAADIIKYNGPNDWASSVVLGAAASGYTSSAEGTITATRQGDIQYVQQAYLKQFPLGREFEVPTSTNLRTRCTVGTAVSAITYICWEE